MARMPERARAGTGGLTRVGQAKRAGRPGATLKWKVAGRPVAL
jgi:hypothetical protein